MPGPSQPVSGPIPAPPNDGLRAARGLAVIENPADPLDPRGRWVSGYNFRYGPCRTGFTKDPCNRDPMPPVEGPQSERRIEPYLAVVGRQCSTFGWQEGDYAAEAVRLLEAFQFEIMAREIWRGDEARASGWDSPTPGQVGNPFLTWAADPEFVDLIAAAGGDPFSDTMHPVEAMAALERALADCSATTGIIHASKRMGILWARYHLIEREGGRLFTPLGTQIVIDRAYDGSGPAVGDDAPIPATIDREWAYATGPITLRSETGTPVLIPAAERLDQAIDRQTNDITFWAQRKVSHSWGCCHAAVAIDTGWTGFAGGSGGSGGGGSGTFGGF